MARTINERADELFLLQSMPNGSGDQWRQQLADFINGVLVSLDFSAIRTLIDPPELRPHLFQEMSLNSLDIEMITKINRFALAELRGDLDTIDLATVTSIGPYAFWESSKLKYLLNTDKVTNLGLDDGISPCTSVLIPYGHVFSGTAIENLNFPLIYNVAPFTFTDMPEIRTIILNSDVIVEGKAGTGAFMDCPKLEFVKANFKTIEDSAFKNDLGLKEAIYPNCNFIGYEAFYNTPSLEKGIFRGSNLKIEHYAFEKSGIQILNLNNVEDIGGSAFKDCSRLEKVSLGFQNENGFILPDKLFENCTNLLELELFSFGQEIVPKCPDTLPRRDELNSMFTILVPDNLLSKYQESEMWAEYFDCFKPLSDDYLIREEEGEIITEDGADILIERKKYAYALNTEIDTEGGKGKFKIVTEENTDDYPNRSVITET